MRKCLVVVLVLSLLAVSVGTAFAAGGSSTLYVRTDNGKSVNVRSAPSTKAEIIGTVKYGGEVEWDWSYAGNDGWTKVIWGSKGSGYIQTRYLVSEKPGPAPKPGDTEMSEEEQKKLENELKSEKEVEPYYIAVRATRTSGWVNFRVGPSRNAERISTFPDGKELIVLSETTNWYKARDPETDRIGYVHQSYASRLHKRYIAFTESENGVYKLGKLNVNGEFDLTCRLPEGYQLQAVNVPGGKIVASVLPENQTRPQLYLTIAYDEMYADVDRMNDLTDEELAVLEDSFREMNDVEITYAETGYGTKLLIAKEVGDDADFVSILSIYKGYFCEFEMTPNSHAADQNLSEQQIQMCIDFLTNVDFVPVEK